ncbi:MAG: 4-hydroxy-tetrahydrodipicolinate reductase [Desulfovibrio sp.]|uniref:4-hydroxy-tetrahydrodipicolinate reductase n=1 Tax=Desulfovibrio sp. 7SRBS1 TaxID=3378064 RepID=UPI003B3C7C36
MSTKVIINGAAGRMGQTLCRLVMEDSDLELVGVVDRAQNQERLAAYTCPKGPDLAEVIKQAGKAVVIDFSSIESSLALAKTVAEAGVMAVIGTTGFNAGQVAELEKSAAKAPIFWAPNMSVGINVLQQILPELAKKLGVEYDMEIMEIHHNKKADAPSGTAVKLAQGLAEARGWDLEETKCYSRDGIIGARPQKEVGVMALRGGDVVGDHTVYFFGPGERIEVTHRAHSRENFAGGALRAAKWLAGQKPGKLYAMADLF